MTVPWTVALSNGPCLVDEKCCRTGKRQVEKGRAQNGKNIILHQRRVLQNHIDPNPGALKQAAVRFSPPSSTRLSSHAASGGFNKSGVSGE